MSTILNASPQAVLLGVDDKSTKQINPGPLELPQHLPKFFFFAERGVTSAELTSPGELKALYGDETVNTNGKFYNHATRFMVGAMGAANTCITQRLVPTDATRANVAVYVDVLERLIPNYKRNSDGGYVLNALSGLPEVDDVTPEIQGAYVKLITEVSDASTYKFGELTSKNGTMSYEGEDEHNQPITINSTMYPLFEFISIAEGEYYNNIGAAIRSMKFEEINTKILNETKSLPFQLFMYKKPAKNKTPVVFKSLYGEANVMFTLKSKTVNPLTKSRFDIEEVIAKSYYNTSDPIKPLVHPDFEKFKFYRDQYEIVAGKLLANEAAMVSSVEATWADSLDAATLAWFDFTTDDADVIKNEEKYLINMFTAKSSKGIPYFTVLRSDDQATLTSEQEEITFGESNPFFLGGGADGTLTEEQFEDAFVAKMSAYSDRSSEVMDMAVNVESIVYDSGFTLDTKEKFANFISIRKDTAIVACTHYANLGEEDLSLSQQQAIAAALKTAFRLAPESEYFGTETMRGVIVSGTGLLPDGSSADRIPNNYSIMIKAARMMGAANGKWKAEHSFDSHPGSVITELVDIRPKFIPETIKPTLWSNGIVWAQPLDRKQYFFPAIQTIYDNDTSVLNSFFVMMAVCTLEKIGYRVWQMFSGNDTLTKDQLADEVKNRFNLEIRGKFADKFVIIPEVMYTNQDNDRGYSWTLVVKLGANNMRTVMTYSIESYRMEDL